MTAVRGHAPREAGAKMVVSGDATLGERRRRQPRGDGGRARPRADGRRPDAAPEPMTVSLSDKAPHRARSPVLRRRGDAAPRAAGRRARRWRCSGSATSGWSWRGSWPATTSSCTSSTPAPTSSAPERLACLDDGLAAVHVHHAPVPELVLGRCRRGTPRAGDDPRPRRGLRAVRRRAALRSTSARSG